MKIARASLALVSIAFVAAPPLAAGDWPRFRGPSGTGVSAETNLPVKWSDTVGLLWKTELSGAGSSSPIVSGGRVFVTCYSGYGLKRNEPGDLKDLRLHVVGVDRASGKILWDRALEPKAPEAPFSGIGMPNHGYASSTPVADGERVYAYFGPAGVVAHDFEGKEIWRSPIAAEPRTHQFGSGASPILAGDLLVVPAGLECQAIVAFDKRTGKEAWRSPADGYGDVWGTPVLVEVEGQSELLLSVPTELWALNPKNGKLRWYAKSFQERSVNPSVIAANGVAYASGGREGNLVAIRIGGRGDTSAKSLVWSGKGGANIPSPVFHDGHLYGVNENGIASCVKAEDGKEVFKERLDDARGVYASLVAADGKLYAVTQKGGTFVLEAGPKFNILERNKFASDDSGFNASPAISNGQIFLRSNKYLYCIKN